MPYFTIQYPANTDLLSKSNVLFMKNLFVYCAAAMKAFGQIGPKLQRKRQFSNDVSNWLTWWPYTDEEIPSAKPKWDNNLMIE